MGDQDVESALTHVNFFEDTRLFQLEFLYDFDTLKCTFCENGRKKVFAAVSDHSFSFYLMDTNGKRSSKEIPWDTSKYSIIDLCFDPSGTWLLVLSQTTLHIVPVLPFLEPDVKHDLKWPTNKITTISLNPNHARNPSAIVWWQTKESQQIAIIGDRAGDLIFFSLENLEIIGKSCIVGGIYKLTIYIDDSLDVITLLITSSKNRQWKLILEQRFCQYNWVTGKKEQKKGKELNKKLDGFLASIKELSSDKMSTLFQSKSHSVTDVPNKLTTPITRCNPTPISCDYFEEDKLSKSSPTRELSQPEYTHCSTNQWVVNPQSADGRHFVSVFNQTRGTFILQVDIEDRKPVFVYKLGDRLTNVDTLIWQDRIIYAFGNTTMKIFSSYFAGQQEESNISIWEDELDEGESIVAAFGMSESSKYPPYSGKWSDTTEISKLDLPRFSLDSCLVVTNKKIYQLKTRCDPCEWLVGEIVANRPIVERTAAALKTCVQPLLLAAADILLARNCFPQALPLYKLAKVGTDEPLMKCAALGMYEEMLSSGISPQTSSAANICFIGHALESILRNDCTSLLNFTRSNTYFSVPECLMLCANIGLWDAIRTIAQERGMLWQSFLALLHRFTSPCRGLWSTLLTKHYAPFLVSDAALPLLKYIEQYCETFDNVLLKELCIWMCPLQDCFHIVFKALSTSQPNSHLSGMRRLIRTFFGLISTLHTRISPSIIRELSEPQPSTSYETMNYKNSHQNSTPSNIQVSCGHSHWAISNQSKLILTNSNGSPGFVNIDLELIGKIISVSCGRNHTLLLTENGVYSLGNNRYGQLGVGSTIGCCIDTPILVGITNNNSCNKANFTWVDEKVIEVVAGQYHSACVTGNGSLYTWGWGVHGQLAHGTITDEFIPKKVTSLPDEKIKAVGCGACHTSILTFSGNVYVCGSGVFGQIGHAGRQKCNIPYRVDLGTNVITSIASGYFHTLALTDSNEIWMWGSSPQSLRVGARGARRLRAASENQEGQANEQPVATLPPADDNSHLYPTKVNTSSVKGSIVKMSAGWHHSCIIDDTGSLYGWGLNLDGQLGTGDQKEVITPTLVESSVPSVDENRSAVPATSPGQTSNADHNLSKQPSLKIKNTKQPEAADKSSDFGRIESISCGADFTIFLTCAGKVFIAGNSYQQFQDPSTKRGLHVVKLKNTKRIIRLPNTRIPAQRVFRHLPLPSSVLDKTNISISEVSSDRFPNPISCLEDFKNPAWGKNTLGQLHQFIDDDTPLLDIQLRAQLASFSNDHAEALNLQLNSLYVVNQCVNTPLYLTHALQPSSEKAHQILLRNIQKLSRNYLGAEFNDKDDNDDMLNCQCKENEYLVDAGDDVKKEKCNIDITSNAIQIIKNVLKNLPKNSNTWADCIHQATMFWIDRELNMTDLENVFTNVVNEGHAIELASAVFCTKEGIDYQKHLSTAFNMELCDNILQSW